MALESCVWGHDQQVRSVWLLKAVFGTWRVGEISMHLKCCVWDMINK